MPEFILIDVDSNKKYPLVAENIYDIHEGLRVLKICKDEGIMTLPGLEELSGTMDIINQIYTNIPKFDY